MSRIDYRTLVNLARKSGLRTNDIYNALAARQPRGSESTAADSNGFVPSFDAQGHRTFKPLDESRT